MLNVSGTVSDPKGDEALIGVSVSVKGDAARGTVTDLDGKYSLSDVPSDATLIFSYVGFQTVETKVNGRTVIDVEMTEDPEASRRGRCGRLRLAQS